MTSPRCVASVANNESDLLQNLLLSPSLLMVKLSLLCESLALNPVFRRHLRVSVVNQLQNVPAQHHD